jgi:dipeptidyl-peptidase-4
MNKRLFLTALTVICFLTLQAQKYSLYDILGGKYSARGVSAIVSSADGMHYYQSDPARTAVIKYVYATGEAVDTLFSTRTARNCNFDSFQGFLVSSDENRVLVYRDREQIYRHSFKANYYYHDVRRNMVRRLSEQASKQMIPTFSPDGKMVAYVIDNDIWLTKFRTNIQTNICRPAD